MYRITRYTNTALTATSTPLRVVGHVDIKRAMLNRVWTLITGGDLRDSAVVDLNRSRRVDRLANGDILILEKL